MLIIRRGVIDLLTGNKKQRVGETSEIPFQMPTSYANDTRRFLEDSYTSLDNHSVQFNQATEQMVHEFQKIGEVWNKKLKDIKEQAEEMHSLKVQLRVQLHEFKQHVNP